MGLYSSSKLWKKDEIAALIALYETERCLYDPSDKHFNDPEEQKEAYERIHKIMLRIRPSCTVGEIKYKINYIQRQYAGEIVRRNISVQSGLCTEETFKSNMWGFELLKFLDELLPLMNTSAEEPVEGESTEAFDKVSSEPERQNCTPKDVAGSSNTVKENGNLGDKPAKKMSGKKRKLCNSASQTVSQKVSTHSSFDEREDIFGQYVASEMKNLKDNPLLYLQTKQSILQILTSANFELLNPE